MALAFNPRAATGLQTQPLAASDPDSTMQTTPAARVRNGGPGQMKVHEAMANAFVKEGVSTVFGLMGNGNMYWWHALDQRPDVTVHETRHEGTALTMAEGWARASGRPGVCTVTQGPGLTQLATALTVATRARIPLVVFAGDTALGDHDAVQQFDQRRFV